MPFLNDLVEWCSQQLTEDWTDYLMVRGFTEHQIRETRVGQLWKLPSSLDLNSLEGERFYRWFRRHAGVEMLVFPITNPRGDIVGINARKMDTGKYDRFTLQIAKAEAMLFGYTSEVAAASYQSMWIAICEGVFDWAVVQRAVPQTVCVLSANISNTQIAFLRRLTNHIVIALDQDEAGCLAEEKLRRRMAGTGFTRLVWDGKDPGEYWSHNPKSEVIRRLREQVALLRKV